MNGLLNCRDNVWVRTATTDVAAHQFPNLVGRSCTAFLDQTHSRTDLTRRAVPALKRVMFNECLLEGMELVSVAYAFDRRDLRAVFHDRQSHT